LVEVGMGEVLGKLLPNKKFSKKVPIEPRAK